MFSQTASVNDPLCISGIHIFPASNKRNLLVAVRNEMFHCSFHGLFLIYINLVAVTAIQFACDDHGNRICDLVDLLHILLV